MALHRTSLTRRGSKNENIKEDEEIDNNGYIQVLVKPLEQGNYSLLLNWLGLSETNLPTQHLGIVYGSALVLLSFVIYQILRCDMGLLFQRLCSILVPMFTIVCAFYWLSLYLRKTWSTTSVYLLFCACFSGESLAQIFVSKWGAGTEEPPDGSHVTQQPLVLFIVLLAICAASLFSSLETTHSAFVICLVSFSRFLTCSTISELPFGLRPFIGYACGLAGYVVSKYMETVFKPPINHFMTHDGKIPVIRRRRSSSSGTHAFQTHRSARRTSLPALIPKFQSSSASYDSAIIGEAHGLITDMLADSTLPPHVVSGLRAVGNLLKPTDNHSSLHKTRVSPLVSLTESTSYGSDTEENPYTGERPSSLPKRLRRSLPPSLLRRMSTSTWTTTTSATGMPTLELEPCRVRSSSFRHSRDTTPGSSPQESRSNSPSPSSPTVVLQIPKSRSFSLAAQPTSMNSHLKRLARKSIIPTASDSSSSSKTEKLSPLVKAELDSGAVADERLKVSSLHKDHLSSIHKKNVTSDYESCNESPSSSDHSDNILTSDEMSSGSPPKKVINRTRDYHVNETEDDTREVAADDEDDGDDELDTEIQQIKNQTDSSSETVYDKQTADGETIEQRDGENLLCDISDINDCSLLQIECLNEWDYPIFDIANLCRNSVLSKVAYKLFMEVGLFETFRIPVAPFLNYFHALEMGYRDKPYHNRVHATDVVHGVYYLTTQPIPGFQQVNNTTDLFGRQNSSSESEGDCERPSPPQRTNSFTADDSYGIMGANFPALELMALFTAAAMHDYDHPGRTNAFLVATHAPQAVLYNDRSVLENHHAASAWNLFLSNPNFNFLTGLDQAEFKRFRYLVIESILATDLKRHFEILAEFNAKVNDEQAVGVDWESETDRLLIAQMVIKLADINGPAKTKNLHTQWTSRIAEEFYEQGDEEASLGMPISPYMDRRNPQLAKLQETFINHLVAPLCNALVTAGLLPGTWVEEESDGEGESDTEKGDSTCKDTEDETETDNESGSPVPAPPKKHRKVNCLLTKNMKENHEMWVARIQEEEQQKAIAEKLESIQQQDVTPVDKTEMEPIKEESESPTPNSPTARKIDQTDTSSTTAHTVEQPSSSSEADRPHDQDGISTADSNSTVDSNSTADSTSTLTTDNNIRKLDSSGKTDSSKMDDASRTVVTPDKQSTNAAQTTTKTLSSDHRGGGGGRGDKT